MNKSSFELILS